MHPLLSPTTHADLEILAKELAFSGYYPNQEESYLKMFLGITLGLTALEALHGLSIHHNQPVLERGLVERILKRNGYVLETATTATACTVSLLKAGRKVGSLRADQAEFNPPLAARPLYDQLLSRLVWEQLPDLFGHKFSIKTETAIATDSALPAPVLAKTVDAVKQQVAGLTTADQIEPKAKNPTKLEQAENSQALLNWQNGIDGLSSDFPGDWDKHGLKLETLTFLPRNEIIDLFERFKKHAKTKGLGYNSVTRKFYMLNYAPHEAYQKETA